MHFMKLAKKLTSLAMLALVVTPASAYDLRDARYVSNSKNIDVLDYIVCLQEKNKLQPRGLSAQAALNKAITACQKEKASLPKDPNEPSAAEIKLAILECGFQLSDASPDMDCGNSTLAKASNVAKKASKDTGPRLLAAKLLGVRSVFDLDGAAICIDKSSDLESTTTAYFKKNKMTYQLVDLKDTNEARKAYQAGLCDVWVVEGASAAVELSRLDVPNAHLLLPESLGAVIAKTTSTKKVPARPRRQSTTTASRQKTSNSSTRPSRPGRPAATNKKPTQASASPRRRTTTKPTRPSGVGKSATARSGFPIIAESRGSNIRSAPRANGKKLGTSKSGQPVTLIENVGKSYKGYPWFKIRLNNGTVGYQWGGGLCAKPRTLVSGTKGTCETKVVKRKRPTSSKTTSSKNTTKSKGNDAADVIVSVLDLVGKIIENGNNKSTKSDASIFSQNMSVSPDGPYVVVSREVVKDKEAALYTVQGKKGQTLNVDVWSPKGNVVFAIYDGQATVGGRTLRGASQDDNVQSFRGELPRNGKYQILVGSVNGKEKFELSVALDSPVLPPVAVPGPVFSGGTVALNRRTVGTYSSKTTTSGNIELNETANALTWTEFCGPTVVLSADWTNNLLLPNSGIGALELKMNKKGKVRGFTYNGHKYTKDAAITMPGCINVPAASAASNGAPTKPAPTTVVYWEDNPKDPRVNRDYDKVPMAWWGICERDNYDQNSPKFNNEKAYWDCADAGQLDGGGTLNANTKAPKKPKTTQQQTPDPRANKNYNKVSKADGSKCEQTYPNSPADDKEFYDCMDAAEARKMNSVKNAVSLSDSDALRLYPELKANDLLGCKADVKSGTMTFKGPGATQYHKCLGMLSSIVAIENSCLSRFAKGTTDHQGCMRDGMAGTANTPPAIPNSSPPVALDPRANTDYGAVPNSVAEQCEIANPNTPADDKGFYDCMDAGLKAVSSAPTTKPAAPDPRANKDYSLVPQPTREQCTTAFPNSPADDKGFYDCMDVGLNAVSSASPTAPAAPQPVAPDPRANNDFSMVPQAVSDQCQLDFPNSPEDDKGFYDCMDVAAMNALEELEDAAGADQDNGVAPDPRSAKEYPTVNGDQWNACWAQEASGGQSVVYDCLDAYEAAASNAAGGSSSQTNDNTQPVGNDALTEIQNYCGGNDQCFVDLENCYYQHGSLDSPEFEQCGSAWNQDQDNTQTENSNNQQTQDTQPANDNQSSGNDPLAEIQSYCGGNDQCFAELESCYYEHGSLESPEFEQCGAAWE